MSSLRINHANRREIAIETNVNLNLAETGRKTAGRAERIRNKLLDNSLTLYAISRITHMAGKSIDRTLILIHHINPSNTEKHSTHTNTSKIKYVSYVYTHKHNKPKKEKMSISYLIQEGNLFMDYIQNMIDIRKQSGMSQKQLAEKIGWSRPQIARYETRTSKTTIEYLEAFCQFYEVSADRVIGTTMKYK